MKREEIVNLASLSRIRLTEQELSEFEGELSTIVDYVGKVSDIADSESDAKPSLGARYNIFRKDEITNEPNQYTKDIMAEMPATDGRYMEVKKILKTDK